MHMDTIMAASTTQDLWLNLKSQSVAFVQN